MGTSRTCSSSSSLLWMREEGEEEEEWSRTMNQPPQLNGVDNVVTAAGNQQLKYICHQCGHQTMHSLLVMKENSLHSSLDTINLAVNQTRRRRKRRRRRLTLSSADGSPEYERLSGGSSSQMQTLDVRIKLTPRVVRETYGQFERREEEVGEEGDDREIYDRIRVRKEWGRYLVKSELRDSSDSFSSNSCSHASVEDTGGSAKKTSRNFFKLKMPLKCLNKVTNFSLFK